MPKVTGFALVVAMQTVDLKVLNLKTQIEQAAENEDVSDLEDELINAITTGDALRTSYEQACLDGVTLPPYEKWVP